MEWITLMDNYNEIWQALGSFWESAENKDIMEEIWSAIEKYYNYYGAYAKSLLNAISGPDMTYKLDVDVYPYILDNDVAEGESISLGEFLNIGSIVGDDKISDYTINSSAHTITFNQGATAGTYAALDCTLDLTRTIYAVYQNIFSYYPVNYSEGAPYSPEEYVYALKAMLYTWRYGYTVNNLQVGIGAIFGMPYTLLGGEVRKIGDDMVYIYNNTYQKAEAVPINNYTITVAEGEELKPMQPLCKPPYLVAPYASDDITDPALIEVAHSSTIGISANPDTAEPDKNNTKFEFLKCFLDAIIPLKYEYVVNVVGYQYAVPEDYVVVG